MRRVRHGTVGLRLLLAAIVLLGMSPTTLSSFECAAGLCGSGCGMHEKATQLPNEDNDSCCPKKHDQESGTEPSEKQPTNDGCKCEFRDGPDATEGTHIAVASNAQVLPGILPSCLDLPARTLPARKGTILFHSDSSPPNAFRHPDLGRAPPTE